MVNYNCANICLVTWFYYFYRVFLEKHRKIYSQGKILNKKGQENQKGAKLRHYVPISMYIIYYDLLLYKIALQNSLLSVDDPMF